MSLKSGLILLTLVSVVADTMMLPFYPQFFAREFNQPSPEHVGYYIAACCITVMSTFPLWAKVARRINEFHLWVYTQMASFALGIGCMVVESLAGFWVLSQLMLVFKASYLLIYPFVMRLEESDKHLGVAGMFSILMHFGAIGGALIGGAMLEYITPRAVYGIMAATDLLQVAVCLYIIRRRRVPLRQPAASSSADSAPVKSAWRKEYVLTLGAVSLLFYLSAFMIRPFFSQYWTTVSGIGNELLAGLVYSIPAWAALAGLWFNRRQKGSTNHYAIILRALCLALVGVALQGIENLAAIVIGRCLYGWALFQITVRLEVALFEQSAKDQYAEDFSVMHLFQNIGVLLTSFSIGSIVSHFDLQAPFYASISGLVVTVLVFVAFFHLSIRQTAIPVKEPQSA